MDLKDEELLKNVFDERFRQKLVKQDAEGRKSSVGVASQDDPVMQKKGINVTGEDRQLSEKTRRNGDDGMRPIRQMNSHQASSQ